MLQVIFCNQYPLEYQFLALFLLFLLVRFVYHFIGNSPNRLKGRSLDIGGLLWRMVSKIFSWAVKGIFSRAYRMLKYLLGSDRIRWFLHRIKMKVHKIKSFFTKTS
ncbi:MAG: hypothetical protein DWQ02_21145 [Bacteroidetes bacterium]|nr:MAG: hypothetical protein DWQ02_21145 [Bacteroidota bacterium]